MSIEISDQEIDQRFQELIVYTAADDHRLQAAVRHMMLGEVSPDFPLGSLDFEKTSMYLQVRYGFDDYEINWAYNVCMRQIKEQLYNG